MVSSATPIGGEHKNAQAHPKTRANQQVQQGDRWVERRVVEGMMIGDGVATDGRIPRPLLTLARSRHDDAALLQLLEHLLGRARPVDNFLLPVSTRRILDVL